MPTKPKAADSEVIAAIELAYNSLKDGSWHRLRDRARAYEGARMWAFLNALSDVPANREKKHNGGRFVTDDRGELVPILNGCPGWVSIYDDEKGAELIVKAKGGDQLAHKVLCGIAACFIRDDCSLPPHLRKYFVVSLQSEASDPPPRRRGVDLYTNESRNFRIAWAVAEVIKLGFRSTRNRATKDSESACSVVTAALAKCGVHLSEPAVEKIWTQFMDSFSEGLSES
jgi:hypothetical protein